MEGKSRKKWSRRNGGWILLGVLVVVAGLSVTGFIVADHIRKVAGNGVLSVFFVTRGKGGAGGGGGPGETGISGVSETAGEEEAPGGTGGSGEAGGFGDKGSAGDGAQQPGSGAQEATIVIRTKDGGDGDEDAAVRGGNGEEGSALAQGHDGKPEGDGAEGREAGGSLAEGQEGTITLAFAGDVLLSDHVLNAYQKGGGITGVVGESLLQAAGEADFFMVNQEFPFSNRGTAAPDKQFTFRLPPEKVRLLQEMGVDLVTLANNHALDFGQEALLDTCAALDGAGIPYVGAGEDLERAKALYTTQLGRWTVGFLGATRVIPVADWAATPYGPGMLSTYDPAVLLEEIRKAKEICDLVVVYVHWGIEREAYPKDYQRQLGRQYLDAGADLVIGSHPHVLQGIEYYDGKPIVYSLGNFVFGSSIPRTVLLKAGWDGEEMSLSIVPATSSGGYTRELTDPAEAQALFQYVESISEGIRIDGEGRIWEE